MLLPIILLQLPPHFQLVLRLLQQIFVVQLMPQLRKSIEDRCIPRIRCQIFVHTVDCVFCFARMGSGNSTAVKHMLLVSIAAAGGSSNDSNNRKLQCRPNGNLIITLESE